MLVYANSFEIDRNRLRLADMYVDAELATAKEELEAQLGSIRADMRTKIDRELSRREALERELASSHAELLEVKTTINSQDRQLQALYSSTSLAI